MKKIIILLICLLVLSACSKQYVCADGTVVTDLADCTPVVQDEPEETKQEEKEPEAPPTPARVESEPAKDIDETTEAFIDKATEKINSFSFLYVGPPENLPRDMYYVKGSKVKVALIKETDHKLSQKFTHVYLDDSRKSGIAYCESKDAALCPEGIVKHGPVKYSDYYVKTPYQWLKSIQTSEDMGNGPMFEKKPTTKIKFTTTGGESGEMYILNFDSLPAKIMLDSGEEIEFRDLATNTVNDEDVLPPE